MSQDFEDFDSIEDSAIGIHNAALVRDSNRILTIFERYHGEDLSRLKVYVDTFKHDKYSNKKKITLSKIVFKIMTEKNKKTLLDYFLMEACNTETKRILMTDVDDTLFPSKVGGTDRSLPFGVLYPGLLAFHNVIISTGLPLIVLTARPEQMAGKTADNIKAAMDNVRDIILLTGKRRDIPIGALATVKGKVFESFGKTEKAEDYEPMANTKTENFMRFQQLFPEYKVVFTGDSGQGDVLTAIDMISLQERLSCLKDNKSFEGAFIHDVKRNELSAGRIEPQRRIFLEDLGIYVFDTYVGAANMAYKHGIISKDDRNYVVKSAQREIKDIESEYGHQELYKKFLQQDISHVVYDEK